MDPACVYGCWTTQKCMQTHMHAKRLARQEGGFQSQGPSAATDLGLSGAVAQDESACSCIQPSRWVLSLTVWGLPRGCSFTSSFLATEHGHGDPD